MKIIEKEIKISENNIPNNSLFLDIETTGFYRNRDRIYLIGTLAHENGRFIFRQIMTENKEEEKELLQRTMDLINKYETLITFNGETFDFGFIEQRASKYFMDINFQNFNSIDLYKIIKEKGFLLDLENFKLKTIEKYIGIHREDMFSGGDLISLYYAYENGDKNLEKVLLLHNEEDILNLPKLYSYKKLLDDKNTIIVRDNKFLVDKISITKKNLNILGSSTIKNGYFNITSSELKIDNYNFKLNSLVTEDNYDSSKKCIYIEKNGINVNCEYGINSPKEILLLKYDNRILHKNAFNYFKVYLENIW